MTTFIIAQFINVVLSTIKSIVTIKAGPAVAGIVNAVVYTVNAVIIKLVSQQDMELVLFATFLTNIIGVPLGKIIIQKFDKDRLWVYDATAEMTEEEIIQLKDALKEKNIQSVYIKIAENFYSFRVFSKSKEDSKFTKSKLNNSNCKYNIVECV